MRNARFAALPSIGESVSHMVEECRYEYLCHIPNIYSALPGEVDCIDLLSDPSGTFVKAWEVLEEFTGIVWQEVPFATQGTFPQQRRHHYSEEISRDEAIALVQENLIPEIFQSESSVH